MSLATLALCACGSSPPPSPPRTADVGAPSARLGTLVERYWDENATLVPWKSWGDVDIEMRELPPENIAPQSLADSLALERHYVAEVSAIPRTGLDAESKVTYDVFLRERALAIEGFTYPSELLPINPYNGVPQQFALMATAAERLALSSAKDYESWRLLAMNFVGWTNQAIVNMRDGMRRGYTLPRVLVEKVLPQLAALGADTQENVFYHTLRAGPDASDAERTRLRGALRDFLKEQILPSYRALHDFLQNEYLPRARTSVGLSALPLGDAWYAHLVKRTTGGTLTPAQLHALGLAEVERAHQRVQSLLAEISFAGNAQSYFEHISGDPRFSYRTAADLLHAYGELKVQVAAAAPILFAAFPRGDFDIRGVEPYRDAIAPASSYRPRAPNGLLAAVLYVDTAGIETRPAIFVSPQFLREGVPGHHYQIELQRERTDLPRFRRFGGAPAFVEGWGLYAETLGDELGLFRDPEAKFGSLLAQMNCAAGLVIDTGVHAQGWTRQQALEYLHTQVPIDEAAAGEVVDRAIAQPAEALACTVGFLKLQGLRSLARQKLGARFELRDFHTEIIKDGALPLDVLEAKIKLWADSAVAGGGTPAGVAAQTKLD
ncbi:MAG: hypothetical protein JWN43_4903 [Gammaproteobacteria bacterium]|nr:hypothetical protein [Gammaproteobacteria bacterium]